MYWYQERVHTVLGSQEGCTSIKRWCIASHSGFTRVIMRCKGGVYKVGVPGSGP